MQFQCVVVASKVGQISPCRSYLFWRGIASLLWFTWYLDSKRATMFLNALYEPQPGYTYFQTDMRYFQMFRPISPWFIFSPSGVYFQIYFQSNVRSIYSESRTMSIFRCVARVVIYSDLYSLFLEQYPHPPAIFRAILHISVLFLVHFQSKAGLIFSPMSCYFQSKTRFQTRFYLLYQLYSVNFFQIVVGFYVQISYYIRVIRRKMIVFVACMLTLIALVAALYTDYRINNQQRGPGTLCSNQTHPADCSEGIDTMHRPSTPVGS